MGDMDNVSVEAGRKPLRVVLDAVTGVVTGKRWCPPQVPELLVETLIAISLRLIAVLPSHGMQLV